MKTTKSKYISFLKAVFPEEIIFELPKVFKKGVVGAGEEVELFEKKLKKYLSVENLLCTSSCTGALTLAYTASGIDRRVKVLSTPMTCAATNIPLLQSGADIQWLDIDPIYGNVTNNTLEDGLKKNPGTRIAVIMDWGGNPCNYDGIDKVAEKYGITLILDAAQSLGSLYDKSLKASRANYICYSFGPTKILSSVEGGAIIFSDNEMLSKLKKLRWYGIDRLPSARLKFWDYQIKNGGYRFTSNNIFASIGLFMLSRLAERIEYHRKIASIYRQSLKDIKGLMLPPINVRTVPNYWLFTVLAEKRDSLLDKLHKHNIHAATPHLRNDELICFKNSEKRKDLPGVEYFSRHYLCLPIGPWVSEKAATNICKIIKSGW